MDKIQKAIENWKHQSIKRYFIDQFESLCFILALNFSTQNAI